MRREFPRVVKLWRMGGQEMAEASERLIGGRRVRGSLTKKRPDWIQPLIHFI